MQPWSDGLLKDLNGGDLSLETTYDTGSWPFILHGFRRLTCGWTNRNISKIHHKASDTIDKVDVLDFKAGEAIVAVTDMWWRKSQSPIPHHIDHASVGDSLKDAKLDELLEHVGVWEP